MAIIKGYVGACEEDGQSVVTNIQILGTSQQDTSGLLTRGQSQTKRRIPEGCVRMTTRYQQSVVRKTHSHPRFG